ncbi:hypothetical protein TNCV_486251 [Trichonephila clavipes]|nr:hypothetical protein TNCV_486251 [Trichonephila clavipes]
MIGHRSPTTHPRRLAAQRLFRVSPCRKGTIHLQIPIPSPRFEHRPYVTAANVINHYTRWETLAFFKMHKRWNRIKL